MLIRLLNRYRPFFLVFYFGTIIGLYVIPASGLKLDSYFILGIRKDHFFHALMFLPMTFVVLAGSNKKAAKWMPVFLLLAAGMETIHLAIPYRMFSFTDMLANVTGAAIGALVYGFVFRRSSTNVGEP